MSVSKVEVIVDGINIAKRERSSNIELLRIFAMSMIIIDHFILHAIFRADTNSDVFYLIFPFFQCGVNLFFLISGYFQISLSIPSLVKLTVLVILFRIISSVFFVTGGGTMSYEDWALIFLFPISKSPYWFIKVYLGLMLMSPIINKGLDTLSLKHIRLIMVLLTIFTVYSCGIGHNICNNNGYTLGQGIYLYCLAHWLKLENLNHRIRGWQYIIIAIILSCVSSYLFWSTKLYSVPAYNGFFTVTISILLFLFFENLKLKSNLINKIASAALGCYLLQDGILGGEIYKWQEHICQTYGNVMMPIILFAACFIVFWCFSFVLTILAQRISSIIIRIIPIKWRTPILLDNN